jgi:PIN domain nuclease of toxin-antitoxin system
VTQVVDSSVVLAYLLGEPGGEVLTVETGPFLLSTVNLTEVLTKVIDHGLDADAVLRILRPLAIDYVDHGVEDAARAARLRPLSRHLGLSLGDRICLAVAQRLGVPVLTSDRNWRDLDAGIDIRLIR